MERSAIITRIEAQTENMGLTILRGERFKKQPIKSTIFYLQVALNRYSPLRFPIKANTVWGQPLEAYETSAIGSIYFLGFYDRDISLFLLKYWDEEGDILDIGANIGVDTSLFTQIAKPSAKVVAFEPTPSTATTLKKNVGTLANVSCEEIAISDKNGVTTFYDYGNRHGVYNSTAAQPLAFLAGEGKEIEVATETLDSYCLRKNIRPSLIKLDTEGTEAAILQNASETLTKYQPLILLEVGGGAAWSENNTTALEILTDYGYTFFTADETGEIAPHTPQKMYQYQNLIAIHSSKVPKHVFPR